MSEHVFVIPLAGRGQRFVDKGFTLPKQMLKAGDRTTMEWSLDALDLEGSRVIFLIRTEAVREHALDAFLEEITPVPAEIVLLDRHTRGSLETVLEARHLIDPSDSVTIFTADVTFSPAYRPQSFLAQPGLDGWLLTFKSNSPEYSYAETEDDGSVTRTAEKVVISDQALVGVYGFARAATLFEIASEALRRPPQFGTEYYIAPVYNDVVASGGRVATQAVSEMHVFGTPPELEFFNAHAVRSFTKARIGVCADHSGFVLKEEIRAHLDQFDVDVVDFGTYVEVDSDYPDHVLPAARALAAGDVDLVFASCRSGQGVVLAAASCGGVFTGLAYSEESVGLAIQHNCANFISLPSAVWEGNDLTGVIATALASRFEGGRHQARLMKILAERQASNA